MQQQCAVEQGLLGKLGPGEKKLDGKTFYLDNVKKRPTTLLLEAISLLGGRVESFLHKDVSFVVTGSQEDPKELRTVANKSREKGKEEGPPKQRESVLSNDKPRPVTPRPMAFGSRGKALLEKAIRNNERLQPSSVLANARSWGVKIVYVEDVLLYLKQMDRESVGAKSQRPEKIYSKQQCSHSVKAKALKTPYLKIEDLSKKYKPLHVQSMTFPTLCYSGRFSPFEAPPPPLFDKPKEHGEKNREKSKDKSQTPQSLNPSPWRPRKKNLSYCECCLQSFTNLEEHLQSDHHRAFVLDPISYSLVDQLVAEMPLEFSPRPSQQSEEIPDRTLLLIQDACELEPLTDTETEHAVQALRRQGSSPTRGPLTSAPPITLAEDQYPCLNQTTPLADIQPVTFNTESPGKQSHTVTTSMPVLDIEPQSPAHQRSLTSQPPQPLTPCPNSPSSATLDSFSLPPVLSPQVFDSDPFMEPHSPYSEPPVLSPQCDRKHDVVKRRDASEMDAVGSVSASLPTVACPISIPPRCSVALTNAGVVRRLEQQFPSVPGVCPSSSLQCPKISLHQSNPLPWQLAITPNCKKRCRFSSPECSCGKRRRTVAFGDGESCTAPERDIMVLCDSKPRQISQFCLKPEISSAARLCNMEEFLSNDQTLTILGAPTAQNSTQESKEMNIFPPSSTSAANQPSCLLSSRTSNTPRPKGKAHSTISSQDSQKSHSTSICIESALIPDLARLSPSSSESDWDCELLSRLGPAPTAFASPSEQGCELDKELLHRPCTWMHDTSYESRLHTVLQPSTPASSLCGDEMDPSAFCRTVVQIVEVKH